MPVPLACPKAHPHHANFGSTAAGSTPHFTAEMQRRGHARRGPIVEAVGFTAG